MDIEKSGKFICEERTRAGLTQKELAERIGVTNKAVSRWETGRGFPDVSMLKPLSDVLHVSVTEIIDGERAEGNALEASDKMIVESFSQRKLILKAVSVILIMVGIPLLFLPFNIAGYMGILNIVFILLGLLFIGAGIFVRSQGVALWIERLNLDLIRFPAALLSLIAAIALETLPNSFLMTFAAPPGSGVEAFYDECSYFDLLPMGYGNFAPMLTGVLSCAAAALLTVSIILQFIKKSGKKIRGAVFAITSAALLLSMTVFLFGGRCMSASMWVCLLILLSVIFQLGENK